MVARSKLDKTSFTSSKPPVPPLQKAKKLKPSTIVYWSRFGLAVLAALICFLLQLKENRGIAAAAALYILSYMVVRYALNYGEEELKGKYKAATLGLGTYIFVWAAFWIIFYTLSPY